MVMNNAITLPSDNLLSVTYYDDYSFLDGKAFGKELAYRDAAGYDRRYECADYPALSAKGLLTGTATRILGDSAMLYKSVYYDYHGNVIQSHEQNALGGFDHCYYRLSFTGKPLEIKRVHGAAGTINEDIVRYTYDSMERLLTISHSHDGASPVTLASNTYDAIGRLTACAVNGGGSVTRYAYNVRGWTRGVTNLHFSQQPHKYGAKELDRENGLDLYDSQARWYAPQIGRTSTLDPMAEKYPHLSPYLWCAANPITLTDPTGKELKPKGEEELQVIKNTIPAEARRFVVINDEGFIDKNKLEEYSGDSYNFQILKYIVNSPITMFVELNDNYNYIDENGELKNSTMTYYDFNPLYDNEDDKDKTGSTISGLSTGETGKMGITLFPDRAGFSGSTNNTIHVIINKNLSEKGAAETYSHEANGHGALYILNGYNHRGASHHFRGTKDTNIKLIDMIIKSKTETVKNMK